MRQTDFLVFAAENQKNVRNFEQVSPSFAWMRTVSKEESQRTLKNMENWAKNWYLCGITKADGFLHTNFGSFFTEQGARKQYTLKQGLEWTGGDTIDDY